MLLKFLSHILSGNGKKNNFLNRKSNPKRNSDDFLFRKGAGKGGSDYFLSHRTDFLIIFNGSFKEKPGKARDSTWVKIRGFPYFAPPGL
jgi:hypothetical protein